ncbi:hypothetical protein Slin15195_G107560 [Septoria linicola]|uniref:NTF2-like domain-containing protein n=1 Tax=Septoria linicola TaxID=215465 RepID=A0A9Q9EP87_9PEZI|nr:hypothetical protein Slin15195_G107560 [Septoria linicola]
MKFALVASALVFATTTLAGGPPGYGEQNASPQQGKPEDHNGRGIASPVGQGNQGGPRPAQNGAPPSYGQQNSPHGNQMPAKPNQNGNGIASPVGQGQNGGQPSHGQQHNPQNNGQPNQNGNGIASPIGQGQQQPGYRQQHSPQSNQGSGKPNQNGNGIASPIGQGQNGGQPSYGRQHNPQNNGQPSQNGNGIASPISQGQQQPGYGQQHSPQSNQGSGKPNQNGNGIASPIGQGQQQPGYSQQHSPQGHQRSPQPNQNGNGIASPVGQGSNGGSARPAAYGQAQKSPQGGNQGPPKGQNGGTAVSPVGNGGNMSGPQCCVESPLGSNWSAQSGKGSQQQQQKQQQNQGQASYNSPHGQNGQCITPQEGKEWLDKFISVLGRTAPNVEQTANEIIADQYIEISNSIQSLQGKPLSSESVSAPSKQAWIQGVTKAPPPQGIQTKDIVIGCDKLVWYWSFEKVGAGRYPQNGFNLFHLVRNGGRLQADRLDLEFDSIAWGLNTGEVSEVELADGTEIEAAMKFQGGPQGAGAQNQQDD